MTTQYPVKNLLLPRSFVYATNSETLVVQSSTPESRLRFVNSYETTGFMLSSSNDNFFVSKDSNVIAQFNYIQNAPIVTIPNGGKVRAPQFEVPAAQTSLKAFVIADYNQSSQHQFVGIGYNQASGQGRFQYQAAATTDVHAFQVAQTSGASAELMRIQSTPTGAPQVGIGTTHIASTVTLAVDGSTQISGDLTVTGNLTFNRTGIVHVDPTSQKISPTILPEKLVFLNSNNQVDGSIIPQSFNFQYLKAQKNVGIGTKHPLQKLHVNGSAFFTERIGIGTSIPKARIHAVESLATIPALRLETNGGNVIEAYSGGSNIFTVYGTSATGMGAGIGIGTTIVKPNNVLQVAGNAEIVGNLACSNIDVYSTISADRFILQDRTASRTYITQRELIQPDNTTKNTVVCDIPFNFTTSIATSNIYGVGPVPYVYVKNTGLRVDGDLVIGAQMYALSDARVKTDVEIITDPLLRLDGIRGYTYVKNAGPREAGLIAQEVQKVLPEAVRQIANEEHLAVAYDAVIPLLVEAVRELSARVKALESSNNA